MLFSSYKNPRKINPVTIRNKYILVVIISVKIIGRWKKNTNSISNTRNKIRNTQKLIEKAVRPECFESKPHSKADKVSRVPFFSIFLAKIDNLLNTAHIKTITLKQINPKKTKSVLGM